jgi:hypothetical protein
VNARPSRHCSLTSKGSTELQQDLDPEQARAIIDPALKIMIDAARRYEGLILPVH